MKKKILTIDDLYNFYLNKNKSCNFSSKDTGYQLSVQIPANFEVEETEDNSLLYCKVKLMHSGSNRNRSNVTDDALTKASKTLAYKPILANFMEYVDEKTGETLKDFTSHDITFDDNGNPIYLEKQIGCFTADKPTFEVEEKTGHNFLYGYCAIPREYTDACSIIERKGGTKISVELAVNEMSFNASTQELELTDVIIMGATCLGKNPDTLEDIEEGMKNARLDISDFSVENNSIKFNRDEELFELLESLKDTLSKFNKEQIAHHNSKEGGVNNKMTKFEELLAKYGKTAEDVTFDYEGMADKELEVKFAEMFDDNSDNEDSENPSNDNKDERQKFEKIVRTYEISHDDIRYALYQLLSEFESADNDWYFISAVYDNHFTYENWDGNKIFGQNYTKDGDNVAFDGERYNLHREFLTDSEFAELQSMRSNYAALVDFKNETDAKELHSQREKVLTDKAYEIISAKDDEGNFINESFAKLYENMDKYSPEDLIKEVKILVGEYALQGGDVETKVEKKSAVKHFSNPNGNEKKTSKYGTLKFK